MTHTSAETPETWMYIGQHMLVFAIPFTFYKLEALCPSGCSLNMASRAVHSVVHRKNKRNLHTKQVELKY